MDAHKVDALLRLPEVMQLTGRGRASLYRDVNRRLFTRPVHVGRRAVAWPASEVAALNRARLAGADEARVQALVDELHAKRQAPSIEVPEPIRRR